MPSPVSAADLALGVKRGTFQEDAREVVCVSFRHTHCKGTSKNTKDNVLERVQQGRMSGKGSVTRSVRIEKDADERLRNLASQGDTSVNTLVNRALRKFVEWDAYGEKFGFITLPSVILVKLMECLTDEEAKQLGAWAGKNLVKEYITFWFKELTVETLLEGFPKLFAKYGLDRKSTRLNSSHANISYAVFCLKKKKKTNKVLYPDCNHA